MKRTGLTVVYCLILYVLYGQTNSSGPVKELDQVIVTASRTYRRQDSLPIPVTVITKKDIQHMGSRRLIDVLREQTGLNFVTDEHGSGLQMQGLDPDYTMILIDGQPLIGRLTGKLDLSRVTVANIERIEIVKGASSSLYGSEALAGVVNIITSGPGAGNNTELALRGGSYGTMDVTGSGDYALGKAGAGGRPSRGGVQLLANYYRTDGYSLTPGSQTLPPFYSYTLQGKLRYDLSQRSSLQLSGRYAYRYQHTEYNFSGNNPEKDATGEKDVNITGNWQYAFNSKWKSRLTYYLSLYNTDEKITVLNTGKQMDTSFFRQTLQRLEWQHDYSFNRQLLFTAGAGGNLESVVATRYPGKQTMRSGYLYLQQQYNPGRRWNIIGGLRGDVHSAYGSLVSPKLAVQYNAAKKLSFKASLGRGFKAPDLRQLYLTFTNPLVGYTVLGTEEVKKGALQQMQEAGQITVVYPAAYKASADLKAEKSWSYNAGFVYRPVAQARIEVNAFYNNVNNLIMSIPIAEKTNGWFVYSYMNVSKVFTKGVEVSGRWQVLTNLELQAGYQLLYAKDKEVIDSIKAGSGSYATLTDPATGVSRRATVKDYFGLPQRSRHQFNAKLLYQYPYWGLTVGARANYFSKSGFADVNGNGYIDQYDQFAPAYCILSFSLEKSILKERLSVQVSTENVTNYTNALIAGQPGRQFFAGLRWNWAKKVNNQSPINN